MGRARQRQRQRGEQRRPCPCGFWRRSLRRWCFHAGQCWRHAGGGEQYCALERQRVVRARQRRRQRGGQHGACPCGFRQRSLRRRVVHAGQCRRDCGGGEPDCTLERQRMGSAWQRRRQRGGQRRQCPCGFRRRSLRRRAILAGQRRRHAGGGEPNCALERQRVGRTRQRWRQRGGQHGVRPCGLRRRSLRRRVFCAGQCRRHAGGGALCCALERQRLVRARQRRQRGEQLCQCSCGLRGRPLRRRAVHASQCRRHDGGGEPDSALERQRVVRAQQRQRGRQPGPCFCSLGRRSLRWWGFHAGQRRRHAGGGEICCALERQHVGRARQQWLGLERNRKRASDLWWRADRGRWLHDRRWRARKPDCALERQRVGPARQRGRQGLGRGCHCPRGFRRRSLRRWIFHAGQCRRHGGDGEQCCTLERQRVVRARQRWRQWRQRWGGGPGGFRQ